MKSGWEAFGKPVPAHRLMKAYETIKEILPNITTKKAFSIVTKCARHIEKDRPFFIVGAVSGLDKDLKTIDLTGRYRLLAVMLT